jgi:hypothetical protein
MADLLSRHAGRGQEWLRQAQRSHWERLFAGRFDEGYATGVRRIGAAHARIGLDPRWYMGGYALALQEIGRILGEARR